MPVDHAPPATADTPTEPRQAAAVPATGADALQALRAATQAIHQRLDSQLPLARADATLADYGRHLQAVGAWLQALAPAWDVPGADPAWAGRNAHRLELIAADLRDCGLGLPADGAAAVSRADAPFAWGLAYVVEGSQLGGQMLHRALAPRFAPHPLRYLRGTGDAADWRGFMQGLRAAVSGPDQVRDATAGAVAGFASLVGRFEAAGELR